MTTAAAGALMLSLTSPAAAQQPILQVRLEGVGQVLVQGRLSSQGSLELPLTPIEELVGEELGEVEYASLPELDRLFGPTVEVTYDSNRALLSIRDTAGRLAATRALYDQRRAESSARPNSFNLGGPYAAVTTELDGGSLIEGGWNFGRVAVGAGHSTVSGTRWNTSVEVIRRTYLTYVDGDRLDPRFGLRSALGPAFVQASYSPRDGFDAQAAVALGAWTVFARDDGSASVSYRSDVQLTVGRTPDRYIAQVSFGRHPSPFAVPRVR